MKLRIRQATGLTLAGLTLGLALVGYETLTEMYPTAGKVITVVLTVCLLATLPSTGNGRHRKAGN